MARCKGCIHDNVCNREVGYGYKVCSHYINAADVAPKSEVAREIFEGISQIKKEYASGDIDGNELYVRLYLLEKKYAEEKK